MTRKIENLENSQLGLFDQGEPSVVLAPKQESQLAILVETLLLEIAVALATGEACDDQDHG
jgi:hypothetical protein